MNGKKLLTELGKISPRYYDEAENETFARRPLRRPFLAAALIAAALLLVGCGVAYVLRMQNLKVGDQEVTTPVYNENLEFQGNATVPQQVLSLAGLKGTPSYRASQEWFQFKSGYDQDDAILSSVWKDMPEYPRQYDAYGAYSQEMVDKLDEIAAKYGLKLQGPRVTLHGGKRFSEEMGIDGILMPDSRASVSIESAFGYENGSWGFNLFYMTMSGEEGQWPYRMTNSLYYNQKDCFSTDLVALDDTGDWVEWNYQTASGQNVLLMMSRSDYAGWIICDREDAMIAVRVEVRNDQGYNVDGKSWFDSTYMSNTQFEQVADAIDFGMKPAYQGVSDSVPQSARAQTNGGYTVQIKSVESDGVSCFITLGVTGPEGTDLQPREPYNLMSSNPVDEVLAPESDNTVITAMSWWSGDDGDGLANTCNTYILAQCTEGTKDGSLPFGKDAKWSLYLEDLVGSYWDREKPGMKEDVLAEGVWNFALSFENSDCRELELIREPVTAEASTGMRMDGSDVFADVQIVSFTIRAYGATILTPEGTYGDFGTYQDRHIYVFMKDGSRVELDSTGGGGNQTNLSTRTGRDLTQPAIDVTQVDYVTLPDGTKLTAPHE